MLARTIFEYSLMNDEEERYYQNRILELKKQKFKKGSKRLLSPSASSEAPGKNIDDY